MNDTHDVSGRQAWSALADGEIDAAGATALSARWRDDADARACWHRYQLIGDVLRSDELAGHGADAAFLKRLRVRLEQEAVVLAPAAASPARTQWRGGMRRWVPPAAVAAGFLAVAGALTVMRAGAPPAAVQQLAKTAAPVPAASATAVAAAPASVTPSPEAVERGTGVLVRDARLDQYLAAHQQFGGSSALGLPSGFLRSATDKRPVAAVGSR